jgi:ligand-binding sensor domain-containing protein/serine phosphatase RsbU (regulator of sigma subunit)
MKRIIHLILLLLPLMTLSQTTSFIQYGVENGLVQSQVQTMIQDGDGNIWIGTLGGLSRYNGEFRSFTRKDSMAEDWVTALYIDKAGNLWCGHWGGGVSLYNKELKRFLNLNVELYTRFKSINAILEDNTGSIWLGTEGAGIYKFNPVANTMISLGIKEGLSGENVSSLFEDKNGNVWIGTDKGLCVYDPRQDITSPAAYTYFNTSNGFLRSDRVSCLAQVNGNEVWVGTSDGGISIIKLPSDLNIKNPSSLTAGVIQLSKENGLAENNIRRIIQDGEGKVWIATHGGGVTQISSKDAKWNLGIFKTYSTKQGLNFYNVNALLADREGNMWIGTDVGLNQFRGERFQIFDEADGMVNNLVWSVLCDKEGNVWQGTNRGVSKISVQTGAQSGPTYTVRNYTTKDGLTGDAVLSMFQDADGDIWFGCGFAGICRLKQGSDKIESVNNAQNGLENATVFSISDDKFGNLWFGTKFGATRFDKASQTWRNYTVDDGLGGNNIYRIFKDSKGNLWFGALGGYLSMYNGSSFKKYDESAGIKHRFILCITEDKSGNLWFGAYGGGLYKFNGSTFINYNLEHGLSSPSPYAIVADQENHIWIGTTNGIDKFDVTRFTFAHYGKEEGFFGVETNPNAICIDKNGKIWFGTIVGAVKFDPKEDRPNRTEPLVSITGLQIFLRDTLFPVDNTFPYDQNYLTFKFSGISLTNPNRVKYMYKLEGFDSDWTPLTKRSEAIFANLEPGEYTFLVKASNNDGLLSSEPAEYRFTITPPFWKTKLFYFLSGVILLLLLLAFDRIRVSKLRADKARLESMVESRTVELAYKNEELAEKNKDITDSIKYAKRIQEAILPPEKVVRKFVSDSFILYKPKDIVSGDFYWMHQQGNNILIAAVDCTGHGVPGAFMSIVGYNLLNKAIEGMQTIDTAEILNRLNRGLSETLKHTNEDNLRDGMDISIVNINFSRKELMYSGAYNPVYVVRNGELNELPPDKISIGSYPDEPNRKYGSQLFNLEKGDSVYLFSDGYADQFGGPNGKKYKYNQFKNLLVDLQKMSMLEQRQLLDRNIEEWRGQLEQVDDILVIGIKV